MGRLIFVAEDIKARPAMQVTIDGRSTAKKRLAGAPIVGRAELFERDIGCRENLLLVGGIRIASMMMVLPAFSVARAAT